MTKPGVTSLVHSSSASIGQAVFVNVLTLWSISPEVHSEGYFKAG